MIGISSGYDRFKSRAGARIQRIQEISAGWSTLAPLIPTTFLPVPAFHPLCAWCSTPKMDVLPSTNKGITPGAKLLAEKKPAKTTPSKPLPATLEEFIAQEGNEARENEFRGFFRSVDYDGDGVIEIYEIRRALARMRGQEDPFYTGLDEPSLSIQSASAFRHAPGIEFSMDLLSTYIEDALDVIRQEEEEQLAKMSRWNRVLGRFARTRVKDQKLDYKVFKKLCLLAERRAWNLYKSIDVNNDGMLSPAELKRAALLDGIHVRLEDAAHFVDSLDRNHDGGIDFPEFRRFMMSVPGILRGAPTVAHLFSAYQVVHSSNISFEHIPWALEKDVLKQEQLRYFAAGAIAGATSRTLTAPLDRIRIYFQVQTARDFASARKEGLVPAVKHVVRNFRTAIKTILSDGGIASFYRGNALNCMRIAPESAISFVVMERLTDRLMKREEEIEEAEMQRGIIGDDDPDEIDIGKVYLSPAGRRFAAGAIAGTCGQFAAYPIETIRMRVMAMHRLGAGFDSSLKISKSTMNLVDTHVDTPSAFFKRARLPGTWHPHGFSAIPKPSFAFAAYSTAAAAPLPPSGPGGLAGLMSRSLIVKAVKDIYASAGIFGFYRGILPATLSIAPFMGTNLRLVNVNVEWRDARDSVSREQERSEESDFDQRKIDRLTFFLFILESSTLAFSKPSSHGTVAALAAEPWGSPRSSHSAAFRAASPPPPSTLYLSSVFECKLKARSLTLLLTKD